MPGVDAIRFQPTLLDYFEVIGDEVAHGVKKAGLFAITLLFDFKVMMTHPRNVRAIHDFANALLFAVQAIGQKINSIKGEVVSLEFSGILQSTIQSVNAMLGVFKIFESIQDFKNNFWQQTHWRKAAILFKAVDAVCTTTDWILTNVVPALSQTAKNIGKTPIASFAGKVAVQTIKNWSVVFACVFSIIDAALILKDLKNGRTKPWLIIACDVAKLALTILGTGLGLTSGYFGSPAWIAVMVLWSSFCLIKAIYEVHEERQKEALASKGIG